MLVTQPQGYLSLSQEPEPVEIVEHSAILPVEIFDLRECRAIIYDIVEQSFNNLSLEVIPDSSDAPLTGESNPDETTGQQEACTSSRFLMTVPSDTSYEPV
jgi:hypothetical protein